MIRRLFKTGNSVVLSIPQEILDNLGVANGGRVSIEMDKQQKRAVITPLEKPLSSVGVDKEFARQVTEFIDRYRPALEELAK